MKSPFMSLLVLSLVAIVFVSGCIGQDAAQTDTGPPPPSPESASDVGDNEQASSHLEEPEENIVEITASGFSPNSLTINVGETVTFINKDTASHWPASSVHPTHTLYPETGGCIGSAFDACKGLKQGETYSFTFNEKGSWGYHDHLNSGRTGTIIVE